MLPRPIPPGLWTNVGSAASDPSRNRSRAGRRHPLPLSDGRAREAAVEPKLQAPEIARLHLEFGHPADEPARGLTQDDDARRRHRASTAAPADPRRIWRRAGAWTETVLFRTNLPD